MIETKSPAKFLYDSIVSFIDLERLINEGESEGQYLECKTNTGSQFIAGSKAQFSKAISAFSNSGGGVIIWGVSTTNQKHTGLDVLTQIECIGNVKNFKKQLDLNLHSLVEPQIQSYESKIILEKKDDTKGVIISYIPPTDGDPIRAIDDGKFWIRTGSSSNLMSYETVRRMFAGSASPDLSVVFYEKIVEIKQDGSWSVPIILSNNTSAAAHYAEVSVTIKNIEACEDVHATGLTDNSKINPGLRIFMGELKVPIFKGKNRIAGNLIVKMKKGKTLKRNLDLEIDLFADNMRAKKFNVTVVLAKKGFSIIKLKSNYLY